MLMTVNVINDSYVNDSTRRAVQENAYVNDSTGRAVQENAYVIDSTRRAANSQWRRSCQTTVRRTIH